MPRATRAVLLVIVAFALGITVSGLVLQRQIVRAGVVEVSVRGDGQDVELRIPGVVVQAVIPWIPKSAMECGQYVHVRPALRVLATELRHAPDCVLVDIQSAEESVLVRKIGTRLQVLVDTPEEAIRVALPVELLSAVLR